MLPSYSLNDRVQGLCDDYLKMAGKESIVNGVKTAIGWVSNWIASNIGSILTGLAVFAISIGAISFGALVAGIVGGTIAMGSAAAATIVQVAFYASAIGITTTFVKEWVGMDLSSVDMVVRMIGILVMSASYMLASLIAVANEYRVQQERMNQSNYYKYKGMDLETDGNGNVKLYRVVSFEEYSNLMSTGKFSTIIGAMEEK